ncbi:LVIVD repeat-containing protein [Ancylobacter terrae]|uniref:LVIVD repeat-containing protein n=1 Tax=Ancylobacter sp. sgz301288 TaxID=3342077 RepID=UPI00385AA552
MNEHTRPDGTIAHNFKLLAHHELDGFGGIGEGMSIQIARDGRRILWLAHETAPKNFTGVDVSDPRAPKVVVQTELPQPYMRSNSLEVVGDIMAVAYQCKQQGQQPAGMELFDISVPENPRSIAFFDCSGPYSRGVHQLWFCDGEYIHLSGGAADFQSHHKGDDQFYRIIDVRNPSKPEEVGRWWLPGVRVGDTEPPPVRHTTIDTGFRVHNTNVYPQRPDRCYIGCVDGGVVILDISDKSKPKMISRWDNSPPFLGFTHTVLPLFDRDLLVVTDEAIRDDAGDWPKLIWILDARSEENLVPISTCPAPAFDTFAHQGGRYGAHNIHENVPRPTSWQSDQIILGTFYNAGLRAYDISNPYAPQEVGYFVPPAPALAPKGTIQLNDVFVDERQVVYTVDRFVGGLYILEMNL